MYMALICIDKEKTMGRMSELALEIEELYEDGFSPDEIAEELVIPMEWVMAALYEYDESLGDSEDGDFVSAMRSAGWGTDEDYGGGCDML
jgi:orotate phosphoribosyltransferase-like protein